MSIAKRAAVVAVTACLAAAAVAGVISPRDSASGMPTGAPTVTAWSWGMSSSTSPTQGLTADKNEVAVEGIVSPRDHQSGLPTSAARPAQLMDVDAVI